MKKIYGYTALLLTLSLLVCGCGTGTDGGTATASPSAAILATAAATAETADGTQDTSASTDASEQFTDRDQEADYDEADSVSITLSDSGSSCVSNAVSIEGSTVTITDAGCYILTGSLSDGQIVVDAEDSDKVQLVLKGVSVCNANSAALYVKQADKVFVTLAADTENSLKNGGSYVAVDENKIDAAVFAKDDLSFNGTGSLTIEAAAGHGVAAKDDLVVAGGSYTIVAASHGLSANNSVRLASGTLTITAGKDGIQADNDEDASLGYVYIAAAELTITAGGDGISASAYVRIDDGSFVICSGGGHTANANSSDSTKGVKATGDVSLSGGSFVIDACDDAIHSNANVVISGGSYAITTGDDGVHADAQVSIEGGSIAVKDSYEGIEGLSILILGGEISIVSDDDGLNAAGGADESGYGQRNDPFASTSGASITITGGRTYINATGDGVDSNGDFSVTGGELYVDGPGNNGNNALDFNGTGSISGGIVVAVCSQQPSVSAAGEQGIILVSANGQAGSSVTLSDATGQTILSWQSGKSFSSLLVSCPELVQGESYSLSVDGSVTNITLSSLTYGSGTGMGGGNMGGNGGGHGGGRP